MGDKIDKLSTAIRLGATFLPQCQGNYVRYSVATGEYVAIATCSLGAAGQAAGMKNSDITYENVRRRFPSVPEGIFSQVIELNDHCDRSRESIATWLEEQGF